MNNFKIKILIRIRLNLINKLLISISNNFNQNRMVNLIIIINLNLNIIIHKKSNFEMLFKMKNFLNMAIVLFIYLMVSILNHAIQHNIIFHNKLTFKIIQAFPICLKVALFSKIKISRFIINKNQIMNLNKIHFLPFSNTHRFRAGIECQVMIWERLAQISKFLRT